MRRTSFILLIFIFALSLSVFNNTSYSQNGSVCKIVFCNCCGDSSQYDIYNLDGSYFAGPFWTEKSGCQDISNWVNLVPGAAYYVTPHNCDIKVRTYFTACTCTDNGDWLDTVKIRCCPGTMQDTKKTDESLLYPNDFHLYQNFPNPFNPTTSIKYYTPVNSEVNLTIYDASGKVVAVLVNGIQEKGNHEATWDAGRFSSGIYFYKLKAGSYSEEKKMVLVK